MENRRNKKKQRRKMTEMATLRKRKMKRRTESEVTGRKVRIS